MTKKRIAAERNKEVSIILIFFPECFCSEKKYLVAFFLLKIRDFIALRISQGKLVSRGIFLVMSGCVQCAPTFVCRALLHASIIERKEGG